MDFDTRVKLAVYRHVADATRMPSAVELAPALRATPAEVRAAFGRLFLNRVLVLEADGETIRMAPPFSGVETQHRVRARGKEYFANCAWDSFGVLAALRADGQVHSRCEQTLEAITLTVTSTGPAPEPCVVHFAVPAARWWADIVFT